MTNKRNVALLCVCVFYVLVLVFWFRFVLLCCVFCLALLRLRWLVVLFVLVLVIGLGDVGPRRVDELRALALDIRSTDSIIPGHVRNTRLGNVQGTLLTC